MIKFLLRLVFFCGIFFLLGLVITKSLPLPGTIPILMYHSIGSKQEAKDQKYFVSRESFEAQMHFLKLFGYRVISIDEYAKIVLGEQPAKGREILITFDDANKTFSKEAWPILQRYGFPVALFLVSESVKQQVNNSMTESEIKEILMSGRVRLGSNSKTHPSLPEMTETQMGQEIAISKKDLEALFAMPIRYFSYPNGDLDGRSISIVKNSGYRLGFTTSYHKLEDLQETPYSITRLNISQSSDNPIVFWVKVTGIYQLHKSFWHRLKIGVKSVLPQS